MALFIDGGECTLCGDCEPVCPTGSIFRREGRFAIDAGTCTECEGAFDEPQCFAVCPIDDCIGFLED